MATMSDKVKTSWSEEDDRVIQGYGYAFTNDAGDLLASGAPYGNTAQPATSEGYVNINLLAKSAGQSTDVGELWVIIKPGIFQRNGGVQIKSRILKHH